MPNSSQLTTAIQQTLDRIPPAISDIQQRKDYAKDPAFAEDVALLNQFNQQLLLAQATPDLSAKQAEALNAMTLDSILPMLGQLISDNLAISKMGPLNTNRSIEPKDALAENEKLAALQTACQNLSACLSAISGDKPSGVRLTGLKVTGARLSPGGRWYQFFSPGQAIYIQALLDPPNLEAAAQLQWQGGAPSPSGYATQRVVPLDTVTPFGTSLTIQATLNGRSESVKVAVLPELLRLDVTGAFSASGEQWSLDASLSDQPAVVSAVVNPDKAEAYPYLRWDGGESVPNRPNQRTVSIAAIQKAGNKLPVEVELLVD